jgi:uncharacterized protein
MSVYDNVVFQPKKMLQSLSKWLDKAGAHAKQKSFEPDTLLQARLAPDQYPLVRQIQSACDSAKFPPARLSGKQPPSNPDTEKSWDEILARVNGTIAYLDTFQEADFTGAGEKAISLPFMEGKSMTGNDYVMEFAHPNFYFHVSMAYAILRHNGVELGKRDYLGSTRLSG